jgi:hypothetical protein
MFYQDLDDDNVAELVKDLRLRSFWAFWSTTTYAAWRYVPTTYFICEADRPSTVLAAQYLVDSARAGGQYKIDNVVRVEAGHSPFISMPECVNRTRNGTCVNRVCIRVVGGQVYIRVRTKNKAERVLSLKRK